MAYKCTFMDNEEYTAQDVNEVFSRMTSAGVVFVDTGDTLSDLNAAQAEAISKGILSDATSCKVVCEDNIYKISQGSCFMYDGASITFDEDGKVIQVTEGVKNYVYLERNIAENTIDIVVSEEEGGSKSVPLAEIDEDGVIYDTRQYATSKVVLGVPNTLKNFTYEFKGAGTKTIEMGADFNYLIFWSGSYAPTNSSPVSYVSSYENLMELTDGEVKRMKIGKSQTKVEFSICAQKNGTELYVWLDGSLLGENAYTINFGVI